MSLDSVGGSDCWTDREGLWPWVSGVRGGLAPSYPGAGRNCHTVLNMS